MGNQTVAGPQWCPYIYIFISLIPFKKWNLYNVYIHSTQTDIFQVFISFNFDDYNWQLMKTPNSVSQKIISILYCEKVLVTSVKMWCQNYCYRLQSPSRSPPTVLLPNPQTASRPCHCGATTRKHVVKFSFNGWNQIGRPVTLHSHSKDGRSDRTVTMRWIPSNM